MSNDQDMTNDNDGRGERESVAVTVRLSEEEVEILDRIRDHRARQSPDEQMPTMAEVIRQTIRSEYSRTVRKGDRGRAPAGDDVDDLPSLVRKENMSEYRFRGGDLFVYNDLFHISYTLKALEASLEMCSVMTKGMDEDDVARIEQDISKLGRWLSKTLFISENLMNDYMDRNRFGIRDDEGYRIL